MRVLNERLSHAFLGPTSMSPQFTLTDREDLAHTPHFYQVYADRNRVVWWYSTVWR
jgi:hypothetical protein